MNLFNKKGKAQKKWRNAARTIDIHKTKIVIIGSRRAGQTQPSHMPPWMYKRLLEELNLTETLDPIEAPQKLIQKDTSEDARARLMEHFGL
jgi:hypothetical protein